MEIRIPYEVAKEAVDKAGNPEEPGTAIGFCVWTSDGEYEILIERPKEWRKPAQLTDRNEKEFSPEFYKQVERRLKEFRKHDPK